MKIIKKIKIAQINKQIITKCKAKICPCPGTPMKQAVWKT
jgi:hypothetical protein